MIKRRELETYLNTLYHYDEFADYCQNGMQIEGSKHIHKIAFGVSFNRLFLEKSVDWNADALIVHHGIFGKNFFELTGILQKKVKICLENGISLFGIHLPMDAHPVIGHNALLADMLGAKNREAFEVGCL